MSTTTGAGEWVELATTEYERRHNREAFALLVWCYPGEPQWGKRLLPTVGDMWYCKETGRVWRYQEIDR